MDLRYYLHEDHSVPIATTLYDGEGSRIFACFYDSLPEFNWQVCPDATIGADKISFPIPGDAQIPRFESREVYGFAEFEQSRYILLMPTKHEKGMIWE